MANPTAAAQRDAYERAGQDVPSALYPPEIWAGYEEWMGAFFELGTDRSMGMGAGPIPAASISRHTTGWPSDEAEVFRYIIRSLDDVYLKSVNKQKGKGGKSPNVVQTGEVFTKEKFRAGLGK